MGGAQFRMHGEHNAASARAPRALRRADDAPLAPEQCDWAAEQVMHRRASGRGLRTAACKRSPLRALPKHERLRKDELASGADVKAQDGAHEFAQRWREGCASRRHPII